MDFVRAAALHAVVDSHRDALKVKTTVCVKTQWEGVSLEALLRGETVDAHSISYVVMTMLHSSHERTRLASQRDAPRHKQTQTQKARYHLNEHHDTRVDGLRRHVVGEAANGRQHLQRFNSGVLGVTPRA
jgi:hypothetical protein